MRTLKTQSTRAKRSRRAAHVPSRARVLRTCCSSDGGGGGKKLTEKLRALKSILPPSPSENVEDGGGGETEQLFQETADYIVRLRTQVVLLQKLIEIYDDSSSSVHKNHVLL